jgi:hypothetical protein
MTTETYRVFRDRICLSILDPEGRISPWLYKSGEPFFYSDKLFHIDKVPVYSSEPEDILRSKFVINALPPHTLYRVVGYPCALPFVKEAGDHIFWIRRAIEDVVYLSLYKERWMHILNIDPRYQSSYDQWSYMYKHMIDPVESCEAFLEDFVSAHLYVEQIYETYADTIIWHHEFMNKFNYIRSVLEMHGFKFREKYTETSSISEKSISEGMRIRNTDEWIRIKELAQKLRGKQCV